MPQGESHVELAALAHAGKKLIDALAMPVKLE
jgi:hypothetical protein